MPCFSSSNGIDTFLSVLWPLPGDYNWLYLSGLSQVWPCVMRGQLNDDGGNTCLIMLIAAARGKKSLNRNILRIVINKWDFNGVDMWERESERERRERERDRTVKSSKNLNYDFPFICLPYMIIAIFFYLLRAYNFPKVTLSSMHCSVLKLTLKFLKH